MPLSSLKIAIIIPCLNEEATISRVVNGFRHCLPDALIYVFDNGSDDETIAAAKSAGALVRQVPHRGKGNVVRRMFADVEADIYVMVDGDDTYDAGVASAMIEQLLGESLDMVVGCRVDSSQRAYRYGHALGNKLFNHFLGFLFSRPCRDIFSGYRVFSRRFVKSFPAQATGFETETELSVHAFELNMPIGYVDSAYGVRPTGSTSKLNTYRDGFRILMTMIRLFRIKRPFEFFMALATLFAVAAIILAIPIFLTFLETGLVPRFPTAILSTGLILISVFSGISGLVLETVNQARLESKMLAYLSHPLPLDDSPG